MNPNNRLIKRVVIMQFSKISFVAIALLIVLGFTSVSMAQYRHPQDSLPTMLKHDSVQRSAGLLEPKSLPKVPQARYVGNSGSTADAISEEGGAKHERSCGQIIMTLTPMATE